MENVMKDDILMLEFKKEPAGNMNKCKNEKERDIYLRKIGKKLFKEHPEPKSRYNKMPIRIRRETRILSQEEIDALLMTVDEYKKIHFHKKIITKIKGFYKSICEWKLIICFSNIEYKICLSGIEKKGRKKYANETESNYKGVLSQGELDELLTAINAGE
jgi:hypothetical protein